ncbi:hypothetical protein HRG_012573 [Hirsutella rhossiliensis]
MSSSLLRTDMPAPHLRKPLDSQRALADDHRIRGLNAEAMARVFLPPPAWLLATEYAPSDRMPMIPDIRLFSLNLSIYGQPIDPPTGPKSGFSRMPASTPTRSHGRLSNATASSLTRAAPFYTMPALVVRDQGYQP